MRRRTLWLILLSCAVPRLLALRVFDDPARTMYQRLAENMTGGFGYTLDGVTAVTIEPLYPAMLAAARLAAGVPGMLLLQVAVACAGGVALFALTRERGRDRAAWIAVALYAVSPYLVRQAASFVEVTVATTLAIVAVWAVQRATEDHRARYAVLAGLVLGALLLTRFSFLLVAVGAVVLLATRHGAATAAVATATILLVVAPWMMFTRARSGMLLPPRIGDNLFPSTSEWAEGLVPGTNIDVLSPLVDDLVQRELGPSVTLAARDRFLVGGALAYASAHPIRTLRLKARNLAAIAIPRLIPFTELRGRAELVDGVLRVPPQTPRPRLFELAAGGFQALLLAGAAAGVWRRRARLASEDAMLILTALSVIAVNVAFFPTSRLLAPMTFVQMFYAAIAFAG